MTPTYPAWPSGIIPAPSLNDNLEMQYPDLVIRSDFDQGAARQRTVYDNGPTTQWLTWPMNPMQAKIFHSWWRNEIASGADWFTLWLFIDDAYYFHVCRFVGGQPTKLKRQGGEWLYAAQVETLDETSVDEVCAAVLALQYVGYGPPTTLTLDQIVGYVHTSVQSLPA